VREPSEIGRISGARDFECEMDDAQEVDLEWIMSQGHLTLYTIDVEADCLVLVGTSQFRSLPSHPNYFEAQRKFASTMCVVPLREIRALAEKSRAFLDRRRGDFATVVMLYATGQCASTHLTHFFEKVLALVLLPPSLIPPHPPTVPFTLHLTRSIFSPPTSQLPGTVAIVEPDFLTQFAKLLLTPRGDQLFEDLFLDVWVIFLAVTLRSITGGKMVDRFHTLVIKPNTLVFQIAERIQRKCPTLRCVFMYRNSREFCEATVTLENSRRL